MLLQLQLPGTKMTRHAIHTSLVYLWADCRECVLKHTPDFGRSGVMKKQSLRFKTTWAFLSFPAAKRNRRCREKNAEGTQRIAEEGWMMLVIGAELTTIL